MPRSTIALLFVSILLPLVLFALATTQNRRDVERAAARRVERTTRILHEHALKVFETHQLMIDQINERLRTMNPADPGEVEGLHLLLAHLRALFPQVVSITVTDADGTVIARGGDRPPGWAETLADTDSFKVLKARDQALPYVSRSMRDGRSGEPVFSMTARAKGRDPGRFAGVVTIAIDQSYFDAFYRAIEREAEHLIVLARDDGGVLASEPATMGSLPPDVLATLTGEGGTNGFLMRTAIVDGEKRLFGYEKVDPYPVVIGFGVGLRTAMTPWRRNMWTYGLVAVLSSLALLGVSGFAIRRIALEGRATRRWRRSAALLETEIAERARVEEQLRQAQKMEAVGRLTGGVAHDFNNLLTVVIGSLDLLSRRVGDGDPRQKALIRNAIDGASRAATLTARLLAFSRQHPLDPRPLDPNALVEGMLNLLQRTLGETVAIELDLAPAPSPVFADPNQLENAILNLCVNAVDAMPKGGVLTVSTADAVLDEAARARHPDVAPGPYVTIAVADTGTGMAPEVVAKAFEPFFTTKPVGKGTGLGLSQVYGFARQSGGHAAIETEPGRGTTIRIYLPRPTAAQAAGDQASRDAVATGPADLSPMPVTPMPVTPMPVTPMPVTPMPVTPMPVTPMPVTPIPVAAVPVTPMPIKPTLVTPLPDGAATVLIVEDDDLVRQFSSAALRDTGYTVIEAGTGPEGLQLLRAHPAVALLFTDIVLKGPIDGKELARQALALRPDLPVLFTTGYTKDAITPSGQVNAAAGTDFIAKPFTTAGLAAKIDGLIGDHTMADERRAAVG